MLKVQKSADYLLLTIPAKNKMHIEISRDYMYYQFVVDARFVRCV